MKKISSVVGLALAAGISISSSVIAADWPAGPVTIVVPFATGGNTDITARLLANRLSEALGQPFVVQNRPGGGSSVGTIYVAQAAPDGQTLLLTSSALTIIPHLYDDIDYDPQNDFAAIGQLTVNRHVIFTRPDSGIETIGDLFSRMEQEPGRLTYSSAGLGSGTHLAAAAMLYDGDLEARHIPYPGAGPAKQAVMSGEVDFMVDAVASALSHINEETVRPLALQSLERDPQLPDVPTISETTIPGFEMEAWLGVLAPAGTPEETVSVISDALFEILNAADVQEQFAQQGMVLSPSTPAEFQSYMESDSDFYAGLIQGTGISAE